MLRKTLITIATLSAALLSVSPAQAHGGSSGEGVWLSNQGEFDHVDIRVRNTSTGEEYVSRITAGGWLHDTTGARDLRHWHVPSCGAAWFTRAQYDFSGNLLWKDSWRVNGPYNVVVPANAHDWISDIDRGAC